MNEIKLYINKSKKKILTNHYGSYSFYLNIRTGGPGFHSKFNFRVSPFDTNQSYQTVLIEFSESLNRFDTWIKERMIYEAFKNGIEKFVQSLKKKGDFLSNSIKIEITDYEPHSIDSKPICNEICIEQALNYIYLGRDLDKRTIFETKYKEYDEIYIEIGESDKIKINNTYLHWGISKEEFVREIGLNKSNESENTNLKHFQGKRSINYSNIISNRAYHLDFGFNEENKFSEFSSQIGFTIKINGLEFKYNEPIENIVDNAESIGIKFTGDDKGNYTCKQFGIILSESPNPNNKNGNGRLEYVYIEKQKETSR